MKKRVYFCTMITFLICSLNSGYAQTTDDLILMSKQFPPFNFEQDGKLQGISIDLMTLCLEKLDSRLSRKDIRIMPWARSYKCLQESENTVLFAMTRTALRENLFKWVGPISSSRNVLLAKKSAHIRINSSEDAAKYSIGAIRDDAGEQLIAEEFGLGREDIEINSEARLSILQLKIDRIDLFAYDENVARWIMRQEGIDPSDYETVYVLSEGFHYFGFNKNTPDSVIQDFQEALDELKEDGTYEKILAKYL